MNALTSERRVTRSFSKRNQQLASITKNQCVILPQTTASSYRRQQNVPAQLYERLKHREKKPNENSVSQLLRGRSASLRRQSSAIQTNKSLIENRKRPSTLNSDDVLSLEEFSKTSSSSETVDNIDKLFHCKELLVRYNFTTGCTYRSLFHCRAKAHTAWFIDHLENRPTR